MADLKSCETCSYVGKSENDYPCSKCTRNASDQWKPMSNADKIRAMDDEELAEFLPIVSDLMCQPTEECMKIICNHGECSKTTQCALKWLQSEAE